MLKKTSEHPKFRDLLEEATSETTPGERLAELAQNSPKLALIVARNPVAPPALLRKLANNDWENKEVRREIRKAVTANPNTSVEDLFVLAEEFPKQFLENPIFKLLLIENPNLPVQIPFKTLTSLLKCPEIPEFFIDLTFQQLHRSFRESIARDSKTQVKCLEILACDRDNLIRGCVAVNPNTPVKILEILAQDRDYFVRGCASINPNTPSKSLESLGENIPVKILKNVDYEETSKKTKKHKKHKKKKN